MLQHRSVLAYLIDAATAAHHRQPIPSLAPTCWSAGARGDRARDRQAGWPDTPTAIPLVPRTL